MKKKCKRLPVDTGNISALPKKLLNLDVKADYKHQIPLKKGKYLIEIKIPDCWNGSVSEEGYLELLEDDVLVIGDSCYFLKEEDAESFWDDYDGGANIYSKGAVANTGGDGIFDAEVVITKTNKTPINNYKKVVAKVQEIRDKALDGKMDTEDAIDASRKLHRTLGYSEKVQYLILDIERYRLDEAYKALKSIIDEEKS